MLSPVIASNGKACVPSPEDGQDCPKTVGANIRLMPWFFWHVMQRRLAVFWYAVSNIPEERRPQLHRD